MNETKEIMNSALDGLPKFSATSLVNKMSAITKEVMRRGVTVITNHNAPTMVLMSVERYIQLEQASKHNLDGLTDEFNSLYAKMQETGVAERTTAALDLDH